MDYYSIESTFSLIKDNFIYYSQDYGNGESPIDKIILNNYITYWKDAKRKNEDVKGVFLELGGYDGITYSNTKNSKIF